MNKKLVIVFFLFFSIAGTLVLVFFYHKASEVIEEDNVITKEVVENEEDDKDEEDEEVTDDINSEEQSGENEQEQEREVIDVEEEKEDKTTPIVVAEVPKQNNIVAVNVQEERVEKEAPVEVQPTPEPEPKPTQKPVNPNPNTRNQYLNSEDIIYLTNEYRATKGLRRLVHNDLLAKSAEQKVDLIFQELHFEHTGKYGTTMRDLISGVGYEMIRIGENLAYGNYKSEQAIVDSWIASPGHNALLISPYFLDIGVSVKKGVFNGVPVWVAVQHFGRPLALCASLFPDSALQHRLNFNRERLQSLSNLAEEKRNLIQSFSVPAGPEYSALVEEYNRGCSRS